MRRVHSKWIALIFAIIFAVSPCTALSAYADSTDQPRNVPGAATAAATTASSSSTTQSKRCPYSTLKKAIDERKAVNKDVAGYLIVPNTNINMPIVAAPSGKNNTYYEKRTWSGQDYSHISYPSYANTATYLDYRVKLGESWRNGTSRNIVIYGHNWTNLRSPLAIGDNSSHIMFAQLPSYTDITFARANPYVYFSTGNMEGVWKVFAVAYAEVKPSFAYNSPNPTNYDALLKEWKQRSIFDFDVDVVETDRILTLSTCTRYYANVGEAQRFVVVARLLRPGESEDDRVSVRVNPAPKTPKF